MRANEMKDQFQLQYDGAKLGNRTFNDREVADFLNKAQQQLIKSRFDALKNRTQRGFSDTAIRRAELDGLISAIATITNDKFIQGTRNNGALRGPNRSTTVYHNGTNRNESAQYGVFAPLPDDALYVLTEHATTCTNNDITTEGLTNTDPLTSSLGYTVYVKDNIPTEEVNYLEYQSRIYDYHAKPYDNLVWSIGYGNWTPGEFDATSGVYTESTKDFNPDAAVGSRGYNIAGYAPFYPSTVTPLTGVGDVVADTYYVVVGGTDKVYGSDAPTDYVTYNGIVYLPGQVFKGVSGETDFTITGGTSEVYVANTINTRRSRYLLPGVSERGRLVGETWHVVEYRCHYLKDPDPIFIDTVTPALQVDCQLADFLHQEVVDTAVKIASAAIVPEQGKYNVNSNEAVINE